MIKINGQEYDYNGDIRGVFNNFTVLKNDTIETYRGVYEIDGHWRTWEDGLKLKKGIPVNVYRVKKADTNNVLYYGKLFGSNTYYRLPNKEVERELKKFLKK